MQATQDGDHQRTAATEAATAQGIHQDPNGVVRLHLNGLGVAGKALDYIWTKEETPTKTGVIKWTRYYFKKLRLDQNAHLLLVQGMSLVHLFMAASLADFELTIPGPLLYVRGSVSPVWEVPCTVTNLVLGRVDEAPLEMKIPEVILAFLNQEVERQKQS